MNALTLVLAALALLILPMLVAALLVMAQRSVARRPTSTLAQTAEAAASWRLLLLERKLDRVLEHLGLETRVDPLELVQELARRGETAAALAAYRGLTGADEQEAQAAVAQLVERQVPD